MDSGFFTNWDQRILGQDQGQIMFHVFISLIIALFQPAGSIPTLHSASTSRIYGSVASDLQKLSVWFQHCHIHVILKGNDVRLESMRNPYILTVPYRRGYKSSMSIYQRCARGRFAIPSSTKMISPCQVTFHINLFQVFAMGDTGELRLAEECTRVYKLKDRHSFILALKEKFELESVHLDRSAGYQGGGNTLLVLLYAQGSTASAPAIQSGLFVCEHCVQLHHNIACTSVENCLRALESTYGRAVQDGNAITWGFLPSDYRPTEQSTGKFSPFNNCLYPREKDDLDCATFPKHAMMRFIVGGLNSAAMTPQNPSQIQSLRSPCVAWSDDDLLMERMAMTRDILQIQVYPMRSENKSRTNLKFITADGVSYKVPSLAMYTQPLDIGLWLGSLSFFVLAVTLIALVSKQAKGTSLAKSARWGMFWVYGAVVEQLQPVPRAQSVVRRAFGAQVLSAAFLLAYVMTNHYKAALNVNYIAGNELVPLWHRIDQLLNFTALYVPMGPCTWNIAKEYALIDHDDDLLSTNKLQRGCSMQQNTYCRRLEDDVPCVLKDEKNDLVWAGRGGLCSSYVHYMQRNGRVLKPMTAECQKKRINVLRSLNRRLKYIPLDQLASYVRSNLTKPNTALITTEAGLGLLWNEFEKAMEEAPTLKFSHNLFSTEDTTIANRDSRLQIVSGMKPEYTKVVTDRVHNFLSTGIWDFWIDFATWRKKPLKLDRFAVPDFAPLTLRHDGIYLLFLLTGILCGLSAVVFAASLFNVWLENSRISGYLQSHTCSKSRQRMMAGKDHVLREQRPHASLVWQ